MSFHLSLSLSAFSQGDGWKFLLCQNYNKQFCEWISKEKKMFIHRYQYLYFFTEKLESTNKAVHTYDDATLFRHSIRLNNN